MRKQLYRTLTAKLQRRLPASSKSQVKNLALLTQALVFSPNCHLSNLALQLPVTGQRENLTQRLRRLLKNSHIRWRVHYLPLVKELLSHWPEREVNLVMDRTDIRQEKSILMLALAFKHRALPLIWQVLPFGGTGEELQLTLLQTIAPYLPSVRQKRICFFGDSEFRAVALQRHCRQNEWGWQVGVKSDTLFHSGDEQWRALNTIPIQQGERAHWHDLTLTRRHSFQPVHLTVDWKHQQDYPRYVICDRPTNHRTWRHGRKRFWIEPFFRDYKSYGFDLESSKITDDARLNRLLLGMAVASLWMLHLGYWVVQTNRRGWLAAGHQHDYSLFRLGRDYAARSQIENWELPIFFCRYS
jgi:hypothetical protein